MLQIPLIVAPSQQLGVSLAGQNVQLAVYQRNTGLYCDVGLNGAVVKTAILCLNGMRLLEDSQYLGFVGDLVFIDTQGGNDPDWRKFGTRYQMLYLEASDLASL